MLRAGVRVCCVIAMVVSCSTPSVAEPADPTADPVGPRVRGATPQMARLIQDGIRRSGTFSALVAALNRTNVIVYVQQTNDLPSGVDGRLAVTTGMGSQRYLRAQVMSGLGSAEMIAIVAHELQHALEVAADAGVRDSKSLLEFYQRIGIEARRGRYDTTEAQAVGWRVRVELG